MQNYSSNNFSSYKTFLLKTHTPPTKEAVPDGNAIKLVEETKPGIAECSSRFSFVRGDRLPSKHRKRVSGTEVSKGASSKTSVPNAENGPLGRKSANPGGHVSGSHFLNIRAGRVCRHSASTRIKFQLAGYTCHAAFSHSVKP